MSAKTGDDRPDGPPRDPHQLGHRGLEALHRQPGELIIKRPSVPGSVASPRHRRHHHAMHRAGHPRRVGLQHGLDQPKVQGPPAPPALSLALAPAALAALPTTTTLTRVRPHISHQQLLGFVILDPVDAGLLNPEQPRP